MTASELSIRPAKPSEAAEIASLSRLVVEHGLRWSWRPARVVASIRDRNVHVIVARRDAEMAGFAIMRYGDDVARLELLGVAVHHRRSGVGRQLLGWLETCAIVAGIARVVLEVRAPNRVARTFYRRLGYRELVTLPGYYQGVEAAIRMARDLRRHRADVPIVDPLADWPRPARGRAS